MRQYAAALACLFAIFSAGCASDEVLRIRSLSTTTKVEDRNDNNGAFIGIDGFRRKTQADNINILFVHGIGWTQEKVDGSNDGEFGRQLAEAVAKAYDVKEFSWKDLPDLCPRSSLDIDKQGLEAAKLAHVLTIAPSSDYPPLVTDDSFSSIKIGDLGCLDRIVIKPSQGPSISIHRFFWDDALWDSVEWPHARSDGPEPTQSNTRLPHPGIDFINDIRTPNNAALKNSVVTWGLMDAAAYLGPAGRASREGVTAAICAVINAPRSLIANAQRRPDQDTDPRMRRTVAELCAATPEKSEPLLLMAHSLGSRVLFDVLVTDLSDALKVKLDNLPQAGLEVHLLANQIPLLGVGRIHEPRPEAPKLLNKPTFVAYSEINDLLTYELVPYFENLYYSRCSTGLAENAVARDGKTCLKNDFNRRTETFNRDDRGKLVNHLGFDVVDVRVKFAPWYPIVALSNPGAAHSEHIGRSAKLRSLLFCGYDGDESRRARQDCAVKP